MLEVKNDKIITYPNLGEVNLEQITTDQARYHVLIECGRNPLECLCYTPHRGGARCNVIVYEQTKTATGQLFSRQKLGVFSVYCGQYQRPI